MARVKLKFPNEKPLHIINIPVRIGDINYGGHLGNDAVLSVIHEARMQLLAQWGFDELNVGGPGMIMADVMIAFKGEGFYGDTLEVKIFAEEFTDRTFDLLYHISTTRNGVKTDIAHAKTGMATFDYQTRKIVVIPEILEKHLKGIAF